MADMIKFYKGQLATLPTYGDAGALYITTDEGAIYLGQGNGFGMKRLGDFVQVTDVEALPAKAHENCLYYCVAENILAKWNGTEWKQINKQPTIEELKSLLGLGSAAYKDAGAFDEAGSAEAVRQHVGEIPEGSTASTIVAYVQERTTGLATDSVVSGKVDKEAGKSLILDTEIARLAEMSDDATKTEASGTNGSIKIDGVDTVVYDDTFVTDMNTINALGGIAAGANLNGLTTHDVLKKLLYPYVDATVGNATASPNGGTYEKGATKTITSVSIAVTKKSEPITSVALYNGSTRIDEKTGDAVKNGGTFTFSGLSVVVPTDGNQLTVKVTYPDANGNAKTVEKKTTAMSFVYPYYMGTCAAGTAIDETLVESLTKKVESKGNKSNSFTVSDGHMVFAYPKSYGVLKSILDPNNFETIGNYARTEVSVTGLDGTAQAYYVYVSGATTVSGFAVNFKY